MKVIEYWTIMWKKIQQNENQIFKGKQGKLLIFLEVLWWVGYLKGDFIVFRPKVGEILNLEKIQIYH